jgi:hypothetical protein
MKKPLLFGSILTVCAAIVAFVFSLGYPGGMISYWKFDEGSGTTATDSVDANHGTIYGATWTTGQVDDALSFDGVNDYVEVPDSDSLDITGSIALEAWIYRTKTNAWQGIIAKFSGDLDKRSYLLYVSNTNRLALLISSTGLQAGPGWGYIFGDSIIPLNEWVHVMGTYDGSYLRVYINGSIDGEQAASIGPIYVSDAPLRIGAFFQIAPYGICPFGGMIDEVAIYNRALSAEEINQHYQDGLHGLGYEVECVNTPSGLVGWWPGDGNADDIVGGNNGTMVGGATFVSPGRVGDSFTFPGGATDYVRISNNNSLEPLNVTVDAWVRSDGTPGNNRYIVAKGAHGCTAASYALYTRSGGLYFYVFNPSYGYKLSPGAPGTIWDGNWHHIAGTYDGAYVRLYVDGVEVGSGIATTIPIGYGLATDNDLIIGQYTGTCSLPFKGDIDEVEIFNRALPASEIQSIYNAGSAGKCKVIEVEIDIKPGSDPNCFNSNNHGVIPVAILGSDDFDVSIIDPFSVSLDGQGVRVKGKSGNAGSLEDVNGDGYIDLVVQILDDGAYSVGDSIGIINAVTLDGVPIEGKDSICITQD